MTKIMVIMFLAYLCSGLNANVLRCDLIDPHSEEADLCWKQLLHKNYLPLRQLVQDEPQDAPIAVNARNAELSSALMQLYGLNKLNGNKRNPEFSRDVMRFISDMNTYKEG